MDDTRIILSGLWVATMLTYLLGDVLRIFAGHVEPGKLNGAPASQGMYLFIAVIMLVPILMVVLSLIVPYPVIRWLEHHRSYCGRNLQSLWPTLRGHVRQFSHRRKHRVQCADRLVRVAVGALVQTMIKRGLRDQAFSIL